MEKINFENLPSTETAINKYNLNKMQDNIEKSCVVVSPTQPTTNEKVWIKKGKNLINIINMLKGYSSATVLEKESNRVVIQGTASTYQYMQLQIKLNPGTYTFQRKWRLASGIAGDSTGIVLANKVSDNSTIFELSKNTTNITFEITEETEIAIYFYLSMNISLTDIVKIEIYDIQLEQGSTATEYEEYINKKIYVKNDNGVFEEFLEADIDKKLDVPTLQNNWVEYIQGQNFIYKVKGIVYLNLGIKSGTNKKILTLPQGWRPPRLQYFPCINLTNKQPSVFSINAEGNVSSENSDVGSEVFINIAFKV